MPTQWEVMNGVTSLCARKHTEMAHCSPDETSSGKCLLILHSFHFLRITVMSPGGVTAWHGAEQCSD